MYLLKQIKNIYNYVLSRNYLIQLLLDINPKGLTKCVNEIVINKKFTQNLVQAKVVVKFVYKRDVNEDVIEVRHLYKIYDECFPSGDVKTKSINYKDFQEALFGEENAVFVIYNHKRPIAFLYMTAASQTILKLAEVDPQYYHSAYSFLHLKKYWTIALCVTRKHRRKKLSKLLVSTALKYCYENNLAIFFDWDVELNPFMINYVREASKELGINLNFKNVSATVSTIAWSSQNSRKYKKQNKEGYF